MPLVGRNHLRRHQTTIISWILKNSSLFSLANENEQNRFLTLGAVEILISNGVYREKLHFSIQVVMLTSSKLYIRNYELRNYEMRNKPCLISSHFLEVTRL